MGGNVKQEMNKLYLGVDVGGTKIMAALVTADGAVRARMRMPTPRDVKGPQVVASIGDAMAVLLAEKGVKSTEIEAIGVAIPGTVAPDEGRIVLTPNMPLSGIMVAPLLQKRFKRPVFIGNDVNLGTLGESWRGAARGAQSAVGIFIGTGIGAGVVLNGHVHEGYRNAAGEIGHVCIEVGGPLCGCGNRGCLEAFASRTAIERSIRDAVEHGRRSIVGKLAGDMAVIKSSVLKRALKQGDELVTEVMRSAAEKIGYACLTVRHILDPEMIVLGGGVIEACGDFMVPVIEQIVRVHSLPGSREKKVVATSTLGDDAVALGAVALAVEKAAMAAQGTEAAGGPPVVAQFANGVVVAGTTYKRDFYVRADGTASERPARSTAKEHVIGLKDVSRACKGGTRILLIGATRPKEVTVSSKAKDHMAGRIECRIAPLAEAIQAYNAAPGQAALIVHWD